MHTLLGRSLKRRCWAMAPLSRGVALGREASLNPVPAREVWNNGDGVRMLVSTRRSHQDLEDAALRRLERTSLLGEGEIGCGKLPQRNLRFSTPSSDKQGKRSPDKWGRSKCMRRVWLPNQAKPRRKGYSHSSHRGGVNMDAYPP